jgi:RimJ/RimL family protein N-acetyltransferase
VKPPPERIETERLVLRRYEEEDIPAFAELLESSRELYAPFLSFFYDEEPAARVRRSHAQFVSGESFPYVAFAGDRLIGGCGLLPRIGPDALEIGYHVRADATGNGYATEMAGTLIDIAFDVCDVERIELHIHPDNTPSIRVAGRLGVPYERMSDVGVYTLRREVRERT